MELLARLESLIEAQDAGLQSVDQDLVERRVLQDGHEKLSAEVHTLLECGAALSAQALKSLRDSAIALDRMAAALAGNIQALTTVTRDMRSGLETLRASADQLKAAVATGDVVGSLTEVEAAVDTASARLAQFWGWVDQANQLDAEVRRNFDRAVELIAETKARLAGAEDA